MAEKTTPRLKTKYTEEVRPALLKEFQHGNVMEVGRVVKVVVNMGVGEAAHDSKMIEGAVRDLAAITGQKPMVVKARNFGHYFDCLLENFFCSFAIKFFRYYFFCRRDCRFFKKKANHFGYFA